MSTSLNVAGRTDVGRTRQQNEDAFTIVDLADPSRALTGEVDISGHRVLLAVSDGMGGHQAGEVASAMVISTVVNSLGQHAAESPDRALELAIPAPGVHVDARQQAVEPIDFPATILQAWKDGVRPVGRSSTICFWPAIGRGRGGRRRWRAL